jgi:uncharacterized protein YciI
MFIIELSYKVPLTEIDAAMKAHMTFVRKYYASGHFMVSGRKIPREGGVILATGESREEVERIAHEDPFVTRGLADVKVTEFRVSQRAPDVEARLDKDQKK